MNPQQSDAFIQLVQKNPYVPYADIHAVLGTQTDREMENILISAIYDGLVEGQLDPQRKIFAVTDWQASIPTEEECKFIKTELGEWIHHCQNLVCQLASESLTSNVRAATLKEEEENHDKEVEARKDAVKSVFSGQQENERGREFKRLRTAQPNRHKRAH